MKVLILAAPVLILATASVAQTPVSSPLPPSDPTRSIENFSLSSVGTPLQTLHDTPTMQRQRLARALSLRAEADALLALSGGTLTAQQQRHFRRAAHHIARHPR